MKKLKLKSISFSPEKLFSVLPYITISISVFAVSFTGWFIYNNVIIAANDAVELRSLSEEVVKTKLNISLYEEVSIDFIKKTEGAVIDISNLRNPFEVLKEKNIEDDLIENGNTKNPVGQ